MNISEHQQKKLAEFTLELDLEDTEGALAEVIRLAKLYGWLRGYRERDNAYSEPTQ